MLHAIDCDVHPTVPSVKALLPYLDDYWRDSVQERGIDSLETVTYPPNAPLTSRPEWRDKNGRAATEVAQLAGYRVRFDGLAPVQESNHFRVVGTFTVSNGRSRPTVMQPAKKFYPQESSPIAGVDYVLGFREDLYLVLGDFTRDGAQATIKIQVNRLVSWIWIGGLILTLGTVLAILPERRSADRRSGDGDRRGAV